MSDLVIATLSRDEARSLTDEVKHDAERLWRKLVELYDGGAHRALGYSSWGAYFKTEFGQSERHGYRLLDAGRALEMVSSDQLVTRPNEAQARELAPLLDHPEELRDAWAEASLNGTPTALTVRETVATRMGVHYSSATDLWSTPQDLFDALHREFAFDLDVCATADNAKCERYYTETEDGLAQEWRGVCWMNPPYGDVIRDWMRKAFESAEAGATVVCLVPARVDTGWWWEYARFGEIRFLRGRLRFGGGETGAPFPSAVVVFPRTPGVVWWERAA